MENTLITERTINDVLKRVINEETSKVKREDFARVQFKIEELQNSLSETIKEFRKLQDSIPNGLKTLSNGRISSINNNLSNTQKLITQLKEKIKQYKKSSYSQQMDEKKKQ
jgi:predicted  nucleic acid-binding Zn-ribbon protein